MASPSPDHSRRWYLAAAVALAAVVAALLGIRPWRASRPASDRVAVAVFVNRTGDAALEPLGSMAADWITRGLTPSELVDVVDVGAIHVQGRSADGAPTDPYDLARRNGAGTVVAGSYYLATDTLVVRATIEDAVSGTVLQTVTPVHVPADAAVRALDQLRERVIIGLAGVFDIRYSPFTARPSAPRSFSAYQSFVAGQSAYWLGLPPAEARAFFQRAAAEDTSFQTSAVWLAFVGANGRDARSPTRSPPRWRPGVRRCSRSTGSRWRSAPHGAATTGRERSGLAKQQAALRPRSTYALYTAGFFGLTSGSFREAHDLLRKIDPRRDLGWLTDTAKIVYWREARDLLRQIDPRRDLGWLSDTAKIIYWRDLTSSAHLLGQYEEEYGYAERLVREFPSRLAPRLFAARALAALGRSEEALEHLRAAVSLPTDHAAHMAVSASPGTTGSSSPAPTRCWGSTTRRSRPSRSGPPRPPPTCTTSRFGRINRGE